VTTVLLLRHGRTRANADGLLAGRTPGVDLDGVGRRQARSLGTRLKDVGLTAVIHSPLERCVQTARAVCEAQSEQVELHPEERLVECDYGQWTGGKLAELAKDPLWVSVQQQPSQVVFPGGEALADMAVRAVDAVRDWCARYPDGVIAMVSHGDVIKAILADALGAPLDEFQRIAVGPGSLSVVSYGEGRPMVHRVNETGGRLRLGSQSTRPTVGGGAG
jgi:probable phosphomutase (TIGR03848 family)